jgi:hypothetical protein
MTDMLDLAKAEQERRLKAGIAPVIDVDNMGLQAIRRSAEAVLARRTAEESTLREAIDTLKESK